jgi:hypothetical protein
MLRPEQELEEIQKNEVEALKAIYMDDFQDCTQSVAWNVSRQKIPLLVS